MPIAIIPSTVRLIRRFSIVCCVKKNSDVSDMIRKTTAITISRIDSRKEVILFKYDIPVRLLKVGFSLLLIVIITYSPII